jgi:hypothetical protein
MALFGTNCGNCKFFVGRDLSKNKPPMNDQGGVMYDEKGVERAEHADLVTLPGDDSATETRNCTHPEVKLPVNNRMCCAYWDNHGALRQWKD